MSNSMSVAAVVLLQRQLDLVLKPHVHGGGHETSNQKFAELAQAQFGIPFVPAQNLRQRPFDKLKRKDRKDHQRPDDQDEDPEAYPQDRLRNRRPHGGVDVTV